MAYQNPVALSQNFARVARQAFLTASSQLVHPGRFKVKTAEGFTYDSFNPRGNPTIWSVIKVFEMARVLGFWGDAQRWGYNFMDIGGLDQMIYVITVKVTCEPEMYEPAVEKQPVQVDNQLVHVGNTSFKLRSNIFVPEVKKAVAEKEILHVFVDKDTRRPKPPPVWWKEKYSLYSQPNEGPLKEKPFDFSQAIGNVHEEEIVVQSVDLDCYYHVNNISFIRFCYEAYIASHVRQFGYTGRGDPFRNVKKLACTYKGEANLGDLLKVHFVQDPQDRDTYHFQIVKSSENNLFECYIQFFPQVLSISKY